MAAPVLATRHPAPAPLPTIPGSTVPFGVNEMRLGARHWLLVCVIVTLVAFLTPRIWKRLERFETGPDYRIPYDLSKDYWLYERRLEQVSRPDTVFVLGDSVIWGEYVGPDGTLSHFLTAEAGAQRNDRSGSTAAATTEFVNAGVNGLFPLALEGLTRYYGGPMAHRKVLLQCNLLWLSSPKADLQVTKEERFNHSRLVPQFTPRIPCYKADANERLNAVVQRNVGFVAWVGHLQNCYFAQKNILSWTLEEDSGDPPARPNAYKNPFAQITLAVPPAPKEDPERGLESLRHRAWSANEARPVHFDWVNLDTSLQWAAFQRLVRLLSNRGADVLVVLGPFNEHMVAEESRPAFQEIRKGITDWLARNRVHRIVPETLPSDLYADASHPLTEGYALLAKRLYSDPVFARWLDLSGVADLAR
ncbi:MAG: hypothetical protein AB9869_19615 [Verrucomicrobiia bacterium]